MFRNFKMVSKVVFGRGCFAQLGDILQEKRRGNESVMVFLVDDVFQDKALKDRLPLNADDLLDEIVEQTPEGRVIHKKRDDPRVTRVGQFIRATSLDELPQLWNVLLGEMSFVGPRPERPVFVEKFRDEIPSYMQKHKVKGGITGWAQVNGWRGDTDLKKRIEHDIYYIDNWSIWLDLKIILLTVFKGMIHPHAY